jgi:hypothetical protein
MEKMERRGGGFAMEKRERRDAVLEWRNGEERGWSAMERRERSLRRRLTLDERCGGVTGSKSKSIYPSIKRPHIN